MNIAERFKARYQRENWYQHKFNPWTPDPAQRPIAYLLHPFAVKARFKIADIVNYFTDACWASLVTWALGVPDCSFRDAIEDGRKCCKATGVGCYCWKFPREKSLDTDDIAPAGLAEREGVR